MLGRSSILALNGQPDFSSLSASECVPKARCGLDGTDPVLTERGPLLRERYSICSAFRLPRTATASLPEQNSATRTDTQRSAGHTSRLDVRRPLACFHDESHRQVDSDLHSMAASAGPMGRNTSLGGSVRE